MPETPPYIQFYRTKALPKVFPSGDSIPSNEKPCRRWAPLGWPFATFKEVAHHWKHKLQSHAWLLQTATQWSTAIKACLFICELRRSHNDGRMTDHASGDCAPSIVDPLDKRCTPVLLRNNLLNTPISILLQPGTSPSLHPLPLTFQTPRLINMSRRDIRVLELLPFLQTRQTTLVVL